jgi:hypothetical protein
MNVASLANLMADWWIHVMTKPVEHFVDFHLRMMGVSAFFVAAMCLLPMSAWGFDFGRVTASGTHVCGGPTQHHCVVSGSTFRNCIDAANSLKVQDCCRTDLACSRDPGTGVRTCESASSSTKFTLDYCVASGGIH